MNDKLVLIFPVQASKPSADDLADLKSTPGKSKQRQRQTRE